jgi:DNA-binding MltR family transcriptional regulator
MRPPFEYLPNNALGHYKTQLPLYGKLLLKMLEGSKYEDIKLLGSIIVRLTEDREYVEYRVDKNTIDTILEMDIQSELTNLKK